ncbi:hypothetical protein ACYSNU_16520, partial [Enterococcus sp. LJL120]
KGTRETEATKVFKAYRVLKERKESVVLRVLMGKLNTPILLTQTIVQVADSLNRQQVKRLSECMLISQLKTQQTLVNIFGQNMLETRVKKGFPVRLELMGKHPISTQHGQTQQMVRQILVPRFL